MVGVVQFPHHEGKRGKHMTDEFKKAVDDDIQKCEDAINGKIDTKELFQQLFSKYPPIIEGFDKRLKNMFDDSGYLTNIKIMKEKLLLFKAMGYENATHTSTPQTIVNNTNTNTNNNLNVIDIDISFEQARKTIENMTALTDPEVEEILTKVDELEKIVQSKERKTKKWENAKGIIKWIADKGVDVGIALLPLLMQIK